MSENKKNDECHLNDRKRLNKFRRDESKHKIPIENMLYKDLPPSFVSVVGPSKCGKSTLVRSLVSYFTNQDLKDTNGLITFCLSKTRRITMYEASTDIHQLVDISKISDIVIFVIDGKFGFEMETFEFLSLLIAHGLPKILCVVTNVDKNNSKLEKMVKKRIWAETCVGIKFFFFGDVRNQKYFGSQLALLCRSLSIMKSRPIEWKCRHPHVIVDRTDEDVVYGYVRGGGIKNGTDVHVPGFGDTKIVDIEIVEDPCPLQGEVRLSKRQKILYAPLNEDFKNGMVGIRTQGKIEEAGCSKNDFEEQNIVDEKLKGDVQLFDSVQLTNLVGDMKSTMCENSMDKCNLNNKTDDVDESESVGESDSTVSEEHESSVSVSEGGSSAAIEDLIEKVKDKFQPEIVPEGEIRTIFEDNPTPIPAQPDFRNICMPGQYTKITLQNKIKVKGVFIIGTYLIAEKKLAILQGKIKKSKWHKKPLKTNEALLFSVGWRRFQSIPIFSMKDATRNRMLKYSLENYCNINFYGPIVPPGTGFSVYALDTKFRVLGFGSVVDITGNETIVKKLKLVGYPKEILKNTVMVKGMFTSDKEVLRFSNANLKTVSGLRGQIKAPKGAHGEFRATFEGEMLMSDVIFLRCWIPMEIYKIFLPVEGENWTGIRNLYSIRREHEDPTKETCITDNHDLWEPNTRRNPEYEPKDDSQVHKGRKELCLPRSLEAQLPLDKREIKTVDKRIRLPISPEDKGCYELRVETEESRRKQNMEIAEKENNEKAKKEKEDAKIEREKHFKKKAAIIASAREKEAKPLMPQEKIKVEKACPNAVIPKKQSLGAAGYDICAIEPGIINAKSRATIRTGLIYKVPHSVIGVVYGRSGLALKNGLDVVSSYVKPNVHEELVISVINNGNEPFVYERGHRIAQLVFLVCASEEMINSEILETTTRGSSGFGSTGVE